MHTGPVKKAGGILGWEPTPSVDGHFDRISTSIDDAFGTEEEFRAMCEVAASHLGVVLDDIVPGHTGKGADFRLAEMKVGDYPGIYHMVEIDEKDWHLLPTVSRGRDSVNLDAEAEDQLAKHGYIIGRMQRVIFYEPGVKDTNWSATAPVEGPDGVKRRWVYLHYFKEGQPSINWLDPSFAGMRLVIGDALHSLGDLGSGALRLDANGFLGVEKSSEDSPAWSEGHPLSEAANQLIASMVRKVGGFTFQELNLTIDDIKVGLRARRGPVVRLRQPARLPPRHGHRRHRVRPADPQPGSGAWASSRSPLVHALQNHDEMTYELVHFETLHAEDRFAFRGQELSGHELAVTVRQDLLDHLTGDEHPYNLTFTQNGIASTTATIIAASLGLPRRPEADRRTGRADQDRPPAAGDVQRPAAGRVRPVRLGPGRGADPGQEADRLAARGRRHPLDPPVRVRPDGLPPRRHRVEVQDAPGHRPLRLAARAARGPGLLRPPAEQDPGRPQALRHRDRAKQIDVPQVSNKAMLVMVHELSDAEQVTVLNFSAQPIWGSVISERLVPGSVLVDMFTDEEIGQVDDLHSFAVGLGPHEGLSLLVLCPGDRPVDGHHHEAGRPSVRG